MAPVQTKRPKETDSVLLRVPAALREVAAAQADEHGLSQNAFITNSLLFGVLAFGEREYVGQPRNINALINEIDRALAENDAAMNAFHTQDWVEVESIVRIMETCEVISNLKIRQDAKAENTTVFSFTLTKNGKVTWPLIKGALLLLCSRSLHQELIPMG